MPLSTSEIGEWSRKIVEVYMQWYTFFVTANLLIMGWFFTKDSQRHTDHLVPVARLFQALNLMGTVSTGMVAYFTAEQIPQFATLIIWAGISNGLGLIGIAYVWGRVIPTSKKP